MNKMVSSLGVMCLILLCSLQGKAVSCTLTNVQVLPDDTLATFSDTAPRDTCSLQGRVTDEEGKALPFVSVKVEGQLAGTMTNLDGRYTLSFQSADTVRITYRLMGYEPKTKSLTRPRGRLTWSVQLRESGTQMGELTVKEVRRQLGTTQELNTSDLRRLPSTSGNAVE